MGTARTVATAGMLALLCSSAPSLGALSPRLESAKLTAEDALPFDAFGRAVALSGTGEIAAIGAPQRDELLFDSGRIRVLYFDSGAVYIHHFDGETWVQQAMLLADDAGARAGFGTAVGLSEDTAIVGAPGSDPFQPAAGAAYLFRREADEWAQEAKLPPPTADAGPGFGASVAISGDTAVVGAPARGAPVFATGAAYVYHFDGATWVLTAELLASDGAADDEFGRSVAVSGDVIAVGARGHDERGLQSGAVYVFRFDGASWLEDTKLLASDATAGSLLGGAVAVAGDVIAAGAPRAFGVGVPAAYVYRYGGVAWTEEAKLETGPGPLSGGFGAAVATSGDTVVVGAPNGGTGSAYVFRFDGAGWFQKPPRVSSDGGSNDALGLSVAVSSGRILAGAGFHNDEGIASGAAYVFPLPAGPIPASAPFVPIDGLPGERTNSSAHAISADGSTVVGSSDATLQGSPLFEAFRWTRSTGTERLEKPQSGFDRFQRALGVSARGLTIVGSADGSRGERAVLWPPGGVPEWILAPRRMVAKAVSADGSVMVGSLELDSRSEEAFHWSPLTRRTTRLGFLPGGSTLSVATDVSDDGTTIVGYSQSANAPSAEFEAFRWTEGEGMVGLGSLPGGDGASRAQDVSPGGHFIVGASSTAEGIPEAFLWSATGRVGLCDPPTCTRGANSSEAFAVSDDGAVVVGRVTGLGVGYPFNVGAFYWTAADGMRLMADVVEQDLGVDLTDWILSSAVGISADGSAITGNGLDADGNVRAWVVYTRLPVDLRIEPFRDPNLIDFQGRRPIPAAILGSEAFDVARVDPATLAFGPAGASPLRQKRRPLEDLNEDGWPDLISHYDVGETGIAVSDTEACVSGETTDGMPFAGCDGVVTTSPCGLGAELVLLLPPLTWLRRRRLGRLALGPRGSERDRES